jgi:hypothetical protein
VHIVVNTLTVLVLLVAWSVSALGQSAQKRLADHPVSRDCQESGVEWMDESPHEKARVMASRVMVLENVEGLYIIGPFLYGEGSFNELAFPLKGEVFGINELVRAGLGFCRVGIPGLRTEVMVIEKKTWP